MKINNKLDPVSEYKPDAVVLPKKVVSADSLESTKEEKGKVSAEGKLSADQFSQKTEVITRLQFPPVVADNIIFKPSIENEINED